MTAAIVNESDNMRTADNEDYNDDIDSLSATTSFQKDGTQQFSPSTRHSNFSYSASVGSSFGSTYLSRGSPPIRSLSMGSPIGSREALNEGSILAMYVCMYVRT